MSEFIIEEVDKTNLTEAELLEFEEVNEEEVFGFGSDDSVADSDYEMSTGSSEDEKRNELRKALISGGGSKQKKKKGTSQKDKKLASTSSADATAGTSTGDAPNKVVSEKMQSIFLQKYMNDEISYNDYAKRTGALTLEENEEQSDLDSDDSISTIKNIKKRTKRQTEKAETHHAKKIKRSLPPALQGLMGEANLCYARGDLEMAKKLCLEIIRQEPAAAEPYITLSQIYENTDEEKYLQLMLLAAHVNSTAMQWSHCGEIFYEKKMLKKASECYSKATRCDPKNLEFRMQKLRILKELGDEKHVLHCTYCMLTFIPKNEHKFLIAQAKWVAQKYKEEGFMAKSLDAMLKAYKKVPEHFTNEDVHSFIELLMSNHQYTKCLDVLISHTGLKIKRRAKTKDTFEFYDLVVPPDMLVDLRTKMCICLISLNAENLITELIDNVITYIDVEKAGDCLLDIAEALIMKKNHSGALRLLDLLVKSESFSLSAVWLKHADCLRMLERFDESIESYRCVVRLTHCVDARLTLAALLKQEGRYDESLEALSQDPKIELMSTELLKEKCLLLKELDRIDEYLEDGYLMLLRHCVNYRSRQELQIVSNFTRTSDRLNELKNLRKNRNEEIEDLNSPEFSKTDEPTTSDDWIFFCDLVNTAWKHQKYINLQKIVFAGMSSRRLQSHVRDIDFMGVIACLFNKEEVFGYNKIREFLNTDKDKSKFWNLFNLIVYVTQDTRYHRFIMRLFERTTPYTENIPPLVYTLIANYYLLSSNYKYALNHYDEIYRRFESPMVAMILAILYSLIANQKYSNRKQNLLVQAMNYMQKYGESREPEAMAEVLFNTGRLYHQLGITHVAKDYYERALKVTNPLIEKYHDILDLKRQIAFNLHIIYKNSGNIFMARKILYDNITF
jgi:general transcription factor 3C polypeptide 3 (transcription factor C subunit 4)